MKNIPGSIRIITGVVILSALIFACGQGGQQDRAGRTSDRERASQAQAFPQEYPIPTSAEVIQMLYRAGAPYILGISNPATNADRYFTERSKALNLGVYGADLSYAAIYEMNTETRRYLQVSRQLVDDLNISTAFNQQFARRVETNLDNTDSLIRIVSDSYYDTYQFLLNQRRDDLSLLVMAGSWIEGMFITSQIALAARDNREINKIILEQDEPLEILLSLMEEVEGDFDDLYNDLSDIHEHIKSQGSSLSDRALEMFAGKIEELRNRIVQA
jgi:uncharacterized protein YfkK (UPF0435 family)